MSALSRFGASVLAATLAGCAVGPDFVPPTGPATPGFLPGGPRSDAEAVRALLDAPCECSRDGMPADWWTLLGSPELDALVARALQASPSVEAARATLARTQALRDAGSGVFWPQVGASLAGTRERTLTESGGTPRALPTYGLATATLSVGYSLDLFGGQRRAVEALGARVDRARSDLDAARLALASNVAATAIARAAYRDQAQALQELAALQAQQLQLAQARFDAGVSDYAPVLALRSSRATTLGTLAALRERASQADTLLARLCAQAPAQARLPDIPLAALHLPPMPPLELPAAWARHRPDILGAEADLHAASADIGVATADLLPGVTLSATGGRGAGSLGALLSSATPFWSVQAAIAGTLLDGGSNLNVRRAAIHAYDAAAARYREVVLAALGQVADGLQALSGDRDLVASRAEAAASADDAARLLHVQWEAGTVGYLDVLTADGQLRAARLDAIGATAQCLQDAVALYVALGGGWWNRAAQEAPAALSAPP